MMDSDRVLVVAGGSVAEYDTPSELLTRPSSLFFQLVNEVEQ